jgi:CRP-like cAMP-binding protein
VLDVLDRAAALRTSSLFSSLPAESLLPIAERARAAALAAGEALFAAGDAGDAVYVLVSGRLRVDRGGGRVDELGPGEVVGEMAAIDGGRRSAGVAAITDAALLRFERDHFLDVLVDHPAAARALAATLAARLRATRP